MTTIPPHANTRATHLTRRGRIVRDLVAGAVLLTLVFTAQHVSVAFFAAVLWAGQVTGLSS